jgi:hypothetical protein
MYGITYGNNCWMYDTFQHNSEAKKSSWTIKLVKVNSVSNVTEIASSSIVRG